jgi:hypothetical protein
MKSLVRLTKPNERKARMIGLTDRQLAIVMQAAQPLSPEKRGLFLQRVDAMLRYRQRGSVIEDEDCSDVCGLARCGLMHQRTDAA